jgi:hypothetical protein
VILQKERGVIEKKRKEFMFKKHRKKCVLQSKSIEKRERQHDPLQNKSKRRILKQGLFRKNTKIFHTLAHLDQVA